MENNHHNRIEKDEMTGDKLLSGHEYDNIRELDNKLPRWWVWLFVITIVYAVAYLILFDVTGYAPHQQKEYENEMAAVASDPNQAKSAMGIDTASIVAITDQAGLDLGKALWAKHCVACHLADGRGLVGPNLTDDYAIHGCSFKQVARVVSEGVPVKGMIPWKNQLTPDQILQVASYVMTLAGTTPPNPKAPEGEKCR